MTDASLRQRFEYLAARLAICQLQELPVSAALRLAEAAGAAAYRLLRKRSHIGRRNIAAAFPGLSAEAVEALLEDSYRNLFRLSAEIFALRRLVRASTWRRHIELVNAESAVQVFLEGRGGIFVSGHLGNWEFLGHVLPLIGIRSHTIARPLDNPLLDRYILGVREAGLQRLVLKRGSGAVMENVLAQGGFVSFLVDQDAGRKGAFVPFFGRHASTWRSVAILSQKTGAPVLPGCCVRTAEDLVFRVIVGKAIYPDRDEDVTAGTLRITADFTAQLEEWVRMYPEQYMWVHRRWKSVPGPRSLIWPPKEA